MKPKQKLTSTIHEVVFQEPTKSIVEIEDQFRKELEYNEACKWFGRGILAQSTNNISELKPTKKQFGL